MESTCNWGEKLVDTCFTKNPGVFHVDLFMYIIGVYLHVDIKLSLSLIFFKCNPRCISHVDYWCTFSGVFHVNCFTWINGVPVHVDIRWISREECHPFLFHMFPTCIFYMDYWCTYQRVYMVDIKWNLSLFFHVWIVGVNFQVYSMWIISRGLMVYQSAWISDGYHVKNATWFCYTCFPRVFFTWILFVYLSTCISGGYHVMVEPRVPSYVYSTWRVFLTF